MKGAVAPLEPKLGFFLAMILKENCYIVKTTNVIERLNLILYEFRAILQYFSVQQAICIDVNNVFSRISNNV